MTTRKDVCHHTSHFRVFCSDSCRRAARELLLCTPLVTSVLPHFPLDIHDIAGHNLTGLDMPCPFFPTIGLWLEGARRTRELGQGVIDGRVAFQAEVSWRDYS